MNQPAPAAPVRPTSSPAKASGNPPTAPEAAGTKMAGMFSRFTPVQKAVGISLLALGIVYLADGKNRKVLKAGAALNDLLLFVNDRVAGYQRAAAETEDASLRSYYQQLVSQSQQFADTLNRYLTQQGGAAESGTTLKGKLYRKFMDAQALVTDRDEKDILAANIYGEEWAMKAYKRALRGKKLTGEIRDTVASQYSQSQQTYARLKQLKTQQS